MLVLLSVHDDVGADCGVTEPELLGDVADAAVVADSTREDVDVAEEAVDEGGFAAGGLTQED